MTERNALVRKSCFFLLLIFLLLLSSNATLYAAKSPSESQTSWFNEKDPFKQIKAGNVSEADQRSFIDERAPTLRQALIRLNPEIAARPGLADEVLYRLRAILLTVRGEGLVRANEEFTTWLRGEHSMPFGPRNEHVPVRLIDFERPENNQYVVTTQYTFRAGAAERRADLVLLVNGFPLVLIEAKTPVRDAVSWVDAPCRSTMTMSDS